jgi:hypothetical protein
MPYKRTTGYALSLPERIVRSLSGLIAGTAHELGEVILPARVRRSRLYSAVLGATLQFLIQQVAEIEREADSPIPQDFLLRRAAGNVVDIAGIAAFHASPVWVLAALSDLAGAGRELVTEIAEALKTAGLLPANHAFSNVDELLNGLERTAGQMVQTAYTPPLNVAAMREEWQKICIEAYRIPQAALPDPAQLWAQWNELKQEAARQERSVLELSSLLAIAAIRALPENARWLSRAIRVSGRRTGEMVADTLLHHYRDTLREIQKAGYVRYWLREFQPYFKGAVRQFSTRRQSTTERLLKGAFRKREKIIHKGTPN